MSPSSSRPQRRPARPSSTSAGRSRAGSRARTAPSRPDRASGGGGAPGGDGGPPASRPVRASGGKPRRRRLVLTEPWKLVRALALVTVVVLIGCGARIWVHRVTGARAADTAPVAERASPDTTGESPSAEPAEAGASPGAEPTRTPAPRTDEQGFAHSDAAGDGTWTTADPVPPSRPGAETVYRYVLRTENGTGVDAAAAAGTVESVLNDDRGWRTAEGVSFEQVSDPASADFVLSIATPPTADALCSPLETASMWNCRNGDDVVLNSDRWTYGTPTFSSIDAYHIYVINHEVGHFLGHEHEYCAGAGLKAPTMAQQSRTRDGGCTENGWPTEDNQGP